ncbi:MAG: 1-(5-phosphoribosyl)-5-[(5-phosphoribosylamino)methylideneamino] imidazole-4-carboxamide isomerase [Rhodobacteraceae bacterium]|nr:1-(5-phosphoribosyl)-5-[(5-phosphoribosylamino)methylideneamino] imidazole-4-carboxamide isomerase [Paracoccaceae bacterium]
MILYPTIELLKGRCVSLQRGRIEDPAIWHVDPLAKAKEFAELGAAWMHLTDFDAMFGSLANRDLIVRIIAEAGIPVQLAGGFRSRDRIEEWLRLGAGRIVVGTLAANNPHLVRELAERHPGRIVLTVDVLKDHVMVEGWRVQSAYTARDFIESYGDTPFAAIVVTDIGADAAETEAALGVISGLARVARVPVIASGVVRTVQDIARLRLLGTVHGALVGRALYNRTIDLAEALAEARAGQGEVAAFI